MIPPESFKIVILTGKSTVGVQLADLLTRLRALGFENIDIAQLLAMDPPIASDESVRSIARKFVRRFAITFALRIESVIFPQKHVGRWHHAEIDLNKIAPERLILHKSKNGCVRPCDVGLVKKLHADVIIQIDQMPVPTELSTAAKFGIFCLIYNSEVGLDSPPPGFWNAFLKTRSTEFQVRCYERGAAKSILICRGSFATKPLASKNGTFLTKQANSYLAHHIKKTAETGTYGVKIEEAPFRKIPKNNPNLLITSLYVINSAGLVLKKVKEKFLGIEKRWTLSLYKSNWEHLDRDTPISIVPPRGCFWADPFLIEYCNKLYCFVEEFDFVKRKGEIVALSVEGESATRIGPCLVQPYHMSFPFLFRFGSHIYMCPEASQSNNITVYRSHRFPLEWKPCAIIMRNVSAADTMIFEHNNKWWLFTNIDKSGVNDHCAGLYIYYASSPLTDKWKSHPMNPVVVDSIGGRNAGFFKEKSKLFRASQVQGFDQYGAGLMLKEIITLDERFYKEVIVKEFVANTKNGVIGTHHITTCAGVTIMDSLTYSHRGT